MTFNVFININVYLSLYIWIWIYYGNMTFTYDIGEEEADLSEQHRDGQIFAHPVYGRIRVGVILHVLAPVYE